MYIFLILMMYQARVSKWAQNKNPFLQGEQKLM